MPDDQVIETDRAGEGVVLASPDETRDLKAADHPGPAPLAQPSWDVLGAGGPAGPTLGPVAELHDIQPLAASIEGLKTDLERRLDGIQTILDREVRAEATRERVVDRLHAELQEYKQDLLLKVQRPIFVDLIQLHDDIGKMIEAMGDADSDDAGPHRMHLQSIQTALEDVLYRQGVEPFTVETDHFDARRQRAIATVPVDDANLNKTVAARVRKGFQAGDKLIRPELVTVRTFRPPTDPGRSG